MKKKLLAHKKMLKPQAQWRGVLRWDTPAVQRQALAIASNIPHKELDRFRAKMMYWLTHDALHPVQFAVTDTEICTIQRGQSRFLAGYLLQKPILAEIQSYKPEFTYQFVVSLCVKPPKPVKILNFSKPQTSIRGFESLLRNSPPAPELRMDLEPLEQWRDFLARARSVSGLA
jgi:hypothetical protein